MPDRISAVVRALADRELSARQAARMMRRSTSRFRHQFTAIVGMNFRTARLRAKLARGAHLLTSTRLTIPEISGRLGYSERSKFEKAFKHVYQVTPTAYRQRH